MISNPFCPLLAALSAASNSSHSALISGTTPVICWGRSLSFTKSDAKCFLCFCQQRERSESWLCLGQIKDRLKEALSRMRCFCHRGRRAERMAGGKSGSVNFVSKGSKMIYRNRNLILEVLRYSQTFHSFSLWAHFVYMTVFYCWSYHALSMSHSSSI